MICLQRVQNQVGEKALKGNSVREISATIPHAGASYGLEINPEWIAQLNHTVANEGLA